MDEDPLKRASSTACCTTGLSARETVPEEEERQIIVESMDETSEPSCPEKKSPSRYATFIVKHPYLLLALIFILVIICGCFSLIPQLGAQPLPDFKEPVKGFEARGTVISDRWRSQMNLFYDEHEGKVTRVPGACGIKNPVSEQQIGDAPAVCTKEQTFNQGKLTVKLVFAAENGGNLLTAENLKSICRLEHKIVRKYYAFDDHCHKANGTQHCCPSWSVGYYIALLNNIASCENIDKAMVEKANRLLKTCSKHYHEGTLKPDCWGPKVSGRCNQVPPLCTKFNAVYSILHYLTDKDFLPAGSNSSFLRYSLVLVPVKENENFQVDIYKSRLKGSDLRDGDIALSGYELSRLKYEIFNERMLADLYLAAIAMFVIMIILWLYTRSLLITSLVGLIVVSSLVIAYFIYTVVLRMKFFPFLNILTSVFLVGIAADDAFVYIDIWNQSTREQRAKRGRQPLDDKERVEELICVTKETMNHAGLSMFVTSFTTSSAFFASLTSDITSIRLFGLYSGLSILCMFFLMVTWFPAAVIIEQTAFSCFNCCSALRRKLYEIACCGGTCSIKAALDKIIAWHRKVFNDLLPRFVIKLRYFWIVFLLILAVGGIIVSTAEPGLQLPSSQDFQMFHESHELEKYPLKLKKYFHFETTKRSSFPINFIWGIKAADSGNQFDPYDMGELNWDSEFDIASKEGQKWMKLFLPRLKEQPFFAKEQKLGKRCFIEDFFNYMDRDCTKNNTICCKASKFPYAPSTFSECMLRMQCERIKEIQFSSHSITDGAPLFDTEGQLRAISLKFDSNVAFTWSYDPADSFWKEAERWSLKEFNKAPSSTNGWFISELQFYDLQKSLSEGTFLSIGISLAIAFGVMLLTTRNVYISVFAILTITCALGVTVGTLVLMGWKLNILESITLSVSVGLSVDFALHYGVAYVLAVDKDQRRSRVFFSMTGMSSAITMAAFTTFVTGAIASQSNVLSYIQLGQFLMIIMSVSWVYATFFFQALCSVWGPENDSGQLTMAKVKNGYQKLKACFCCEKDDSDHYQIVRKEDGTEVKKSVRVLYIKTEH
ncbi:protein dispatched homolog 1-like [Dendronephthya gigantea]|uniref:protein dispatched homolog 1-like n=1 Tax=Dendronephthya gigantea TaxID=151771 RepID=UPI00106BB99D|nr:protein dispatched homolog 1-like [Dendronephthya gigantea]XP_028410314.1 protein dispatched homolog 1-like [Dendronephthya gigantea]